MKIQILTPAVRPSWQDANGSVDPAKVFPLFPLCKCSFSALLLLPAPLLNLVHFAHHRWVKCWHSISTQAGPIISLKYLQCNSGTAQNWHNKDDGATHCIGLSLSSHLIHIISWWCCSCSCNTGPVCIFHPILVIFFAQLQCIKSF